jgi:hypothetical protein
MGWTGSGVDVDGTVELDGHVHGAALLFDEPFLVELELKQLGFGHLALVIGVVHSCQVRQKVENAVSVAVELSLNVL